MVVCGVCVSGSSPEVIAGVSSVTMVVLPRSLSSGLRAFSFPCPAEADAAFLPKGEAAVGLSRNRLLRDAVGLKGCSTAPDLLLDALPNPLLEDPATADAAVGVIFGAVDARPRKPDADDDEMAIGELDDERTREKRLPPAAGTDVVLISGTVKDEELCLRFPLKRPRDDPPMLLTSDGFDAKVATTVGVRRARVMVVALVPFSFLRRGRNVGLLRDENGRISGVNVFLREEDGLEGTRPRPESSPLPSSLSSPSPSESPEPSPEPWELSIASGDGELVGAAKFGTAVDAVITSPGLTVGDEAMVVGSTLKLEVLSMICAYRPSIRVPTTWDS